jgi:hypothetical protein
MAYTGLGFLLVMNRMIDSQSKEWAEWTLFFALGGFVGNFGLTLWVGVWASAVAFGFLVVAASIARVHFALCRNSRCRSSSGRLGIRPARGSKSPWALDPCIEEFHVWSGTVFTAAFPQPGAIRDDWIVETMGRYPRIVRGAYGEIHRGMRGSALDRRRG